MPLPAPIPGLVIRYGYLWHSDYLAGHEEGKDRPAAIIATLRPADDPGETRVLVLPITHSPPAPSTVAVECLYADRRLDTVPPVPDPKSRFAIEELPFCVAARKTRAAGPVNGTLARPDGPQSRLQLNAGSSYHDLREF